MNAPNPKPVVTQSDTLAKHNAKLWGCTVAEARAILARLANAPKPGCGMPRCDCGDILNHSRPLDDMGRPVKR